VDESRSFCNELRKVEGYVALRLSITENPCVDFESRIEPGVLIRVVKELD